MCFRDNNRSQMHHITSCRHKHHWNLVKYSDSFMVKGSLRHLDVFAVYFESCSNFFTIPHAWLFYWFVRVFPPGLAVGLGIGALAEVAKKSIRHNGAAGNTSTLCFLKTSLVMCVNITANRPCGRTKTILQQKVTQNFSTGKWCLAVRFGR